MSLFKTYLESKTGFKNSKEAEKFLDSIKKMDDKTYKKEYKNIPKAQELSSQYHHKNTIYLPPNKSVILFKNEKDHSNVILNYTLKENNNTISLDYCVIDNEKKLDKVISELTKLKGKVKF